MRKGLVLQSSPHKEKDPFFQEPRRGLKAILEHRPERKHHGEESQLSGGPVTGQKGAQSSEHLDVWAADLCQGAEVTQQEVCWIAAGRRNAGEGEKERLGSVPDFPHPFLLHLNSFRIA